MVNTRRLNTVETGKRIGLRKVWMRMRESNTFLTNYLPSRTELKSNSVVDGDRRNARLSLADRFYVTATCDKNKYLEATSLREYQVLYMILKLTSRRLLG